MRQAGEQRYVQDTGCDDAVFEDGVFAVRENGFGFGGLTASISERVIKRLLTITITVILNFCYVIRQLWLVQNSLALVSLPFSKESNKPKPKGTYIKA